MVAQRQAERHPAGQWIEQRAQPRVVLGQSFIPGEVAGDKRGLWPGLENPFYSGSYVLVGKNAVVVLLGVGGNM
jgi:hypothetical protein